MSSIPESAMHHAKADPELKAAKERPGGIVAAVKAHPVAAAAVGATVIAGAVAAVAAPKLREHKPAAVKLKAHGRKPAAKTTTG